ncbi:Imm50 family immunity protein [Salinispora cortesiana]|uniref:Imm50 family immunity protein n=1 Tax=Salinispora cortesiana TaxID=1305843 RepID=UPI0009B71E0B|nr:Imm50 family immunity protein [Salinispora cortesiana]
MASWIDLLGKPDGIRAVYGEDLPTLSSVDLHELSLHRDGPLATLRFDLAEFPRRPPKKWADQGFNVVQVQLSLGGVQRLTVAGWEVNVTLDIEVERRGDVIYLRTLNGPVGVSIEARSLVLSRLSAHRDALTLILRGSDACR